MGQDDFDDRIAKLRASGGRRGAAEAGSGEDSGIESAMSFGLRAGAQFVSAVVVGGGVGWALDRWLGTRPFGMLILMVLGFVAAMMNVWLTMSRTVAATESSLKAGSGRKAAAADDKVADDRVTDEIDGKSS